MLAVAACLCPAARSHALMIINGDLAGFTAASAQIVRGKCLTAVPVTVEVAGAKLAATKYRFKVVDRLKGETRAKLDFMQIGLAGGGARDIGRMAGLPVYSPGTEYVLFLLPKSAVGLTSPAGAGQGAFEVAGDEVTPMVAAPAELTSDETAPAAPRAVAKPKGPGAARIKYSQLRKQILELVAAGGATPE